jgi:hypothetical protein
MYMRLLVIWLIAFASTCVSASDLQRLAQAAFANNYRQAETLLERKNQALVQYLWSDIYAAALYTEPGISPQQAIKQGGKQRLELYYYRPIAREYVIKAAWQTLERQHTKQLLQGLRTDIDVLHASFRDIQIGDRYALTYAPATGLNFERNGQIAFSSSNQQLAKLYLGIWLEVDGLSEELRSALLAEK